MNFEKSQIRTCALYEYLLGHSASEAHRNMMIAFGKECPGDSTCRVWFANFKDGTFGSKTRSAQIDHRS